jgi:hypothetical protein
VIPAVDIAVFILDANPLAPSRPVIIPVPVPVIFMAIPVATIPVSISIMSAAVVVPISEAAISIAVAFSITLAFTIPARPRPFVRLLLLRLCSRRVLRGRGLCEAGGHPAHENSRDHQ